jgi:polysaccharide biosynthesis/export protein
MTSNELRLDHSAAVVVQAHRLWPGSRTNRLARALVTIGLVASLTLSPTAQQTDYVLGSQDVLTITVWGQGGLSDRFTVETDGTFTFPIVGRVRAGGLTVRQLQDALTHQLADGYFKDPRVTVVVQDYRSQRIFIVGEIRNPGTYTLTRATTLVEALALAGSTTTNAGGVALLRRRTDGAPSLGPLTRTGEEASEVRVDLSDLQEGVLSNNPILRDGDTIAVPRAAPVYVFGYVGRPGEYTIGRGATLRQVLSLAGGISQRGAEGRIKIVRMVDGNEQEIKVELDDRVRPGDTIVVPERFF